MIGLEEAAMSTDVQQASVLNGWNLEAMEEAIEQVKDQPKAGRLVWRSTASWDGGFGLDVRTRAIEQMGEAMPRHFTLRGDHPPELLGQNTGPTAIETLMAALASCLAGTFAAQATGRGVELRGLELDIEAAIDLNGFFGLSQVPPGLSDVRVSVRAATDADDDMLAEILEAARRHSPVYDSVTRPVSVVCDVVRRAS